MLIHVTQDDIDGGRPEDDCRCPVSIAVRLATGIPTSVTGGVIIVDYATPWQQEINSPEEVACFVSDFDGGLPVEPFSFELDFDAEKHRQDLAAAKAA